MSQTKAQLLDGSVVSVAFSAGTAGAPSLTFTGDSNTGIYSPGADQVAISTGGSGRLFVDASGRVAAGGAPVAYQLEARVSGNGGISINNSGDTGSDYSVLDFTQASSQKAVFYTNGGNLTTNVVAGAHRYQIGGAELMRLTSTGLGIGNSSPGYPLTVNGRISYVGAIGEGADTTLSSASTQIRIAESSTWQSLSLYTAGSSRLFITPAGNVGIGTTSPGVKFTVVGSPGDLAAFSNATDASVVISASSGVAKFTNDAASGAIAFGTGSSGTERARIDSSGRLLVGTSSSSVAASLVCQATSASSTAGTQIWLQRGQAAASISTGDTLGRINFADNAGSTFAWIDGQTDGGAGTNDYPGRLVFATTADGNTSPTERFRISSTGAQSSVIPGGSTLYPSFDCRAWVNFNGTSTVAIRGSGNVSSITDNGAGNYTVNFTTAMPDANYAVVFGIGGGGAGLNAAFVAGVLTSTQYGVASNKTASAVQFTTGDYTATLRDLGEIYVSIFR